MSKSDPLAEKIARLLESEMKPTDIASLFASIEKINRRLEKLETTTLPSVIQTPQLSHPSLEKFDVAEAMADEIFAGIQKEKACTFEPNGKPCDHCAMCNSRGF
ncbi:MAG: hypothetical protein DMF63_02860 [Acidobacteria bacterium]|nr:MAG: hypothetical protein DMF63_02860 [Acidobacteriota bacterium]